MQLLPPRVKGPCIMRIEILQILTEGEGGFRIHRTGMLEKDTG